MQLSLYKSVYTHMYLYKIKKPINRIPNYGCNQILDTNALKHLMDQSEERILQID